MSDTPPPGRNLAGKLVAGFFAVATLVGLGFVGVYLWAQAQFERPGPNAQETRIILPRGLGLTAIGERLAAEGVLRHPTAWSMLVHFGGRGRSLKAGEYVFPPLVTPKEITRKLAIGDIVIRRLTVAEGLSTAQVMALVRVAEGLDGEAGAAPGEGEILPETYHFTWGDGRAALVDRMRKSMSDQLERLWRERAPDLPLKSPREALVLASIVEKETGVAAERPRVAAVFHNRLRLGMKLQSDPTVIYGITQGERAFERAITRDDLNRPTRWNTYVIEALPPTPIANPGLDAIKAVLKPAKTDELYFVADGAGGHAFAKTLAEHNRNVARYRALQAEKEKAPAK
ncbi:MAG: endolytic transglycosylase MltG [Alphaproteobacteria bacterium]|nr:endolytic transglycosylase MltG [Alphaproteobacteria bacterium]